MRALLITLPVSRREFSLPKKYPLPEGSIVRIGRSEGNDIRFQSVRSVSRFHAILEAQNGAWTVRNLSQSNPILVNGVEVSSVGLHPGDILHVGAIQMQFRSANDDEDSTVIEYDPTLQEMAREIAPGADPPGLPNPRLETLVRFMETSCVRDTDEDIYKQLREALSSQLSADQVLILKPQGDELLIDFPAGGDSPNYSARVIQRARESAHAILWRESDSLNLSASALGFGITSAICAPVLRSEIPQAYVYLHRIDRPPFTENDLAFVSAFARVAALVEDNLRLRQRLTTALEDMRLTVEDERAPMVAGPTSESIFLETRSIAKKRLTVLLRGETGTGKDILARFLHFESDRQGEPFIAINCAAIPESLLESELFGYAPRSGIANAREEGKPGRFVLADKGTLFLDEIGDLPPPLQPKLLRFLETGLVEPIGSLAPEAVDVRLVCATNQDLEQLIELGRFRKDLYYRIKDYELRLPPLRERRDEIIPLALHFLEGIHAKRPDENRPDPLITREALRLLPLHSWPGNIRELRKCMERADIRAGGGTIHPEHLEQELVPEYSRAAVRAPVPTLAELEIQHIRRVLELTHGNKKMAAEFLGIHRNTLTEKLRRATGDA